MDTLSEILIIDDEELIRDTLDGLLSTDFRWHMAADGLSGLSLAAELRPDIILLDVMMPGLDGFEVCARLRATPATAEIPIIMVTALDDRESRLRGLSAGADDFLTKPFDRLELLTRCRSICRLNWYRFLLSNGGGSKLCWVNCLNHMIEPWRGGLRHWIFVTRKPKVIPIVQ